MVGQIHLSKVRKIAFLCRLMSKTSNRRKERALLIMLLCMLVVLVLFLGDCYLRRTASLRILKSVKIGLSHGLSRPELSLSRRSHISSACSKILSFWSVLRASASVTLGRTSCFSGFPTSFDVVEEGARTLREFGNFLESSSELANILPKTPTSLQS